MKKILLSIFFIVTVVLAEGQFIDSKPPQLKASCTFGSSFVLYKNTICDDVALSMFKPRCIELNFKRMFNMDTSEAKYYNDDEAKEYLKNK